MNKPPEQIKADYAAFHQQYADQRHRLSIHRRHCVGCAACDPVHLGVVINEILLALGLREDGVR
jgi:hypothetical protein